MAGLGPALWLELFVAPGPIFWEPCPLSYGDCPQAATRVPIVCFGL